jgi:hypothetical protein
VSVTVWTRGFAGAAGFEAGVDAVEDSPLSASACSVADWQAASQNVKLSIIRMLDKRLAIISSS